MGIAVQRWNWAFCITAKRRQGTVYPVIVVTGTIVACCMQYCIVLLVLPLFFLNVIYFISLTPSHYGRSLRSASDLEQVVEHRKEGTTGATHQRVTGGGMTEY